MADMQIKSEWITLDVSDGTTMPAYVARPTENGTYPGLLVFQEAFGVNAHMRDVTERFARQGYTAVAPTLYHRTDAKFEGSYTDFAAVGPHRAAMSDEGQSADINAAYDWLVSKDGGGAAAVGSVGYCMGGRSSFLANILVPLKAAVSYYGGGIAPSAGSPFPAIAERASELHAPALIIWGGLDGHIGPDQRGAVEEALRAADKRSVHVTFSHAGHGFFCDVRDAYEPHAARQSWVLTLDFLDTYLRSAAKT